VSEQACALADSPASPSNKTPQQSSNTPQVKRKNEASTQVTPRRSFKKRQNKKKNNQKELDPNRQWDDATHHQVPGVPPPTAPPTPAPAPAVPTVVINNHGERAEQVAEDEGFVTVTSRKQKKKTREERQAAKPLAGADRPDTVFLYITSCHPDTNEEDIEDHLSDNFENISSVKAHKTVMTHNYYTSFTVTVRGREITPELFLDSDAFPRNVKVFLNRNKYNRDQRV